MDISNEHLKIIRDLLGKHVPEVEVRAFGSRVNGHAKPHSDLDIALMTSTVLSPSAIALLKADFSESDLPFKVDVLDWQAISDSFRKLIEQGYEILEPGT